MAAFRAGSSAVACGLAVLVSGCAPQPTPAPGAPDDCVLLCAVIRSIAGDPEPAAPAAKPPKPSPKASKSVSKAAKPAVTVPKPGVPVPKPAATASKPAVAASKPAARPSPPVHGTEAPPQRKARARRRHKHGRPPRPTEAAVPLRGIPNEAPAEVSTVPRTPDLDEAGGSAASHSVYTLMPGSAPIEDVTSRFMPMPTQP